MHYYFAFGFHIASDIKLPWLLPSDYSSYCKYDGVRIQFGEIDTTKIEGAISIGHFAQAKPHHLWFHVPNIAQFHIKNGNTIMVMPANGAHENSIRLFLLGSCIGTIAHQRGQLVLRGSAVRFKNQSILFLGGTKAGKSTLAAIFHQQGYSILSDDLCVIDKNHKLQPGYPYIKLWQNSANKCDIDTSILPRIRHQINKYAYPLKQTFCRFSLPVSTIYILQNHNANEFIFEPLFGVEKFISLKSNIYRSNSISELGLQRQQFSLCSQLANETRITRIIRPQCGSPIQQLVECLADHINDQQDITMETNCD